MAKRDMRAVSPLTARISGLRRERGLTQEALAAGLRLRQSTVAGWEAGRGPTLDGLVALADYYGVDLYWLATGKGEKKPRPVGEAEKILAQIRRLVEDATPTRPALSEAKPVGRRPASVGAVEAKRARRKPPGESEEAG